MNLTELKASVEKVEGKLANHPYYVLHTFKRNGRRLHLGLTERLHRRCRRGRVWKSKGFLTALANAKYGFQEQRARSAGGADGIFILTRDHRPRNNMMRKLFDRFLDHPKSGANRIATSLGCSIESLIPVRLVSHHMRLLGVLQRREGEDVLVLVDYDDTK